MRVAIVSDYFPPVSPGGAELSALHLAKALHGHVQVEVVTTDFGVRPELPFPVHYVQLSGVGRDSSAAQDPRSLFEGAVTPFSRAIHYVQFARKLGWLARSRDFDLIHTQQIGSEVAAYLGRPLHRLPRVTTVRGYRHLADRWQDDAAARHGIVQSRPRTGLLSNFKRSVPRAAAGSGSHLFAVSDFVRRAYVGGGVAKDSASSTVYNVIPAEQVEEADAARAAEILSGLDGPVLLFAGRLTDGKGLSLLIDAMPHVLRQIPETTLVVAGGGDSSAYRTRVAANLASFGVRFTGHVENVVVRALIARANAVVVPSLHHEPLGRVLLEAIAAGVPVVVTPYGGTPEVIEHGRNGLLCEPDSLQALASVLLEAIRNRDLAASTRQFDSDLVKGKLSPERTVESTLNVYEEVLAA